MRLRRAVIWMFSCASAALILWAIVSSRSPEVLRRPDAPDEDRGPSAAAARGGPHVVPLPRDAEAGGPPAPAAAGPSKTGVLLAQSYRDDACSCDTKACWREVNARYREAVGLAVPRSSEEARIMNDAFHTAAGCLQRIDATEPGRPLRTNL